MVLEVDDAVELYREYSKLPYITSGRIANSETAGHVRVYSVWGQRDLESLKKISFSRNHILQLDVCFSTPPILLSNELMSKESPSGKYHAILREVKNKKGETKQYMEVWTDSRKLHNVNLDTLEKHGDVITSGTFSCLEWSHAETHLLYVAERKRPKAKSFFDKKGVEEEIQKGKEEAARGEEFVYRDNWGEQMSDQSHPVICVLDVEGGVVSTLDNVPEDVSPGQAVWCPDDQGVVCVGWFHDPYRLGLVYCPIRRNSLFHINLKTSECSVIGGSDRAVQSPRFSPDNSRLIYLDNNVGGPHAQCSRLMMIDWSTKGVVPVVDVVRKPKDESAFPGLYTGRLGRCFAKDGKRVVLSTRWRSSLEIVVIHTDTGNITRLTNDKEFGSWNFLDISRDLVLAEVSSPNCPSHLVIGHLPEEGQESGIKWTKLDGEPQILPEIQWKVGQISPPDEAVNPKYVGLDYEYYILYPTGPVQTGSKPPLAVFVHGGPHSVFSTEFFLTMASLCGCGYAVLSVNYRGSLGFGQDGIDSLPGNIGTQDVNDCQYAVKKVLESGDYDKERVVVIGGSHGGFLTTHLIGQFPGFYKAAVCRNPVINVASMLGTTDIPDWCMTEGGMNFDPAFVYTPEVYADLLKRSPIRYADQISTPTMVMIGADDKRVPPRQGQELRTALQARGIPVRTLVYPDNAHPIITMEAEADAFINIISWFNKYTK